MNKQLHNKVKSSNVGFQLMSVTESHYTKAKSKPNLSVKLPINDEVISEEELLQFWWRY